MSLIQRKAKTEFLLCSTPTAVVGPLILCKSAQIGPIEPRAIPESERLLRTKHLMTANLRPRVLHGCDEVPRTSATIFVWRLRLHTVGPPAVTAVWGAITSLVAHGTQTWELPACLLSRPPRVPC